jgi:hypothetical protein
MEIGLIGNCHAGLPDFGYYNTQNLSSSMRNPKNPEIEVI